MGWNPGFKKIYFPNIIFRLIRTPSLPPNKVAFRIPTKVNKLDIKDYLTHIYKLDVVDVRTMVYAAELQKYSNKYRPSYKKAIVTLSEDFNYPPTPSDSKFSTELFQENRKSQVRKLAGWKSRPIRVIMKQQENQKLNEEKVVEKENKDG
ncbi:19779_t:CDS:1 [Funneliformis geosporum]|uniref:Large ribosomal subunit protein uL23m n=1 Tax=Funneliformis geosporum TaxID=1117311 RepID=A0A9W4WQW2_9GLOM|nr:19779_t:CDS:1 [Funneliformis geosporum]CAI2179901.1 4757_t:CDS:1 [Funneliformis geosporum]